MSRLILYHGSPQIVEKPQLEKGKTYNDYGQGFYCTEHLELAKEWACTEGTDGYVNQYELEAENLRILNLDSEKYTILHWLALLMKYRVLRLHTPVMRRGAEWLQEQFFIDLDPYDLIIGWRADDSYFSFARAFVNNEISLGQLNRAMRLGNLGQQVVLKTATAFDALTFVSCEPVDGAFYYPRRKARDRKARESYLMELELEEVEGIYIRDLIREGVKPDDTRLR